MYKPMTLLQQTRTLYSCEDHCCKKTCERFEIRKLIVGGVFAPIEPRGKANHKKTLQQKCCEKEEQQEAQGRRRPAWSLAR